MWDLPGPGLKSVFLALAGGFLTTAPPGKSQNHFFFSVLNLWSVKTLRLKACGLTILFFLNSRWQYLFTCSKNLNHSNDYRLRLFSLPPCRVKSVYLNCKTEDRNSLHVSIILLLKFWLKGYKSIWVKKKKKSIWVDENYDFFYSRVERQAAPRKGCWMQRTKRMER